MRIFAIILAPFAVKFFTAKIRKEGSQRTAEKDIVYDWFQLLIHIINYTELLNLETSEVLNYIFNNNDPVRNKEKNWKWKHTAAAWAARCFRCSLPAEDRSDSMRARRESVSPGFEETRYSTAMRDIVCLRMWLN